MEWTKRKAKEYISKAPAPLHFLSNATLTVVGIDKRTTTGYFIILISLARVQSTSIIYNMANLILLTLLHRYMSNGKDKLFGSAASV